ncbi:MAG: hypothetical protein KBT67_11935 [bacterium]|nr:hypothetical protein [Candidatus Limimorpha caballi]
MKPQILIFVDDDFQYGLEQGMYPDLANKTKFGTVQVENLSSYKESLWNVNTPPSGDKDIYFLNPYTEQYLAIGSVAEDNDSLTMKLVMDKSSVIKEVFVKMGAKRITLVDTIKDNDKSETHGGFSGGNNVIGGGGNMEYNKELSVEINNIIKSHDPEREPKPYEEVKQYVIDHGLGDDGQIKSLLDRLKSDGRISGTEEYDCTFLSELKSSLKIAAHIETPSIHGSADFGNTHSHIHEITKKITLEF